MEPRLFGHDHVLMSKAQLAKRGPALPVETNILARILTNRAPGRRLQGWGKLCATRHANESLATLKLICHAPILLQRKVKRTPDYKFSPGYQAHLG